jgi:hypothetical protein
MAGGMDGSTTVPSRHRICLFEAALPQSEVLTRMDATLKKVLGLFDTSEPPEVRRAAALIVTELAPADGAAHEAIRQALNDLDVPVRLQALHAVGKLKIQDALPVLLSRIEAGGEEASAAANAAAKLGARAVKSLQDMMPKVAPGLRRYIAAALGSAGTASGDAAAVEFLLDKDPGVVASAVRSLISQVPTLTAAKKQGLADQLLQLLKDAKTNLPVASEAAAVRLLAAVGDKRAEAVLWDRCVSPHPAEIRAAALQALGGLSEKPGKDQLKRLFACALEADFRVAAPALMMLQHQTVSERTLSDWLGLFAAADVAARRLALDKLAGYDSPAIAAALLSEMAHPDRAYREAVLARLAAMAAGQKALQAALLDAATADAAWSLARALTPFLKDFSKAHLDKVFAQACQFLDAGDRRAEPLLFILREADAAGLRERLEEKALAGRKKKDYEKALSYLKLLARDPAIGFALRFELACCGLKLSNKELAARGNDPCLGQFAHLIQGYEGELTKALDKAKWLEPDDLFYLGFHFIEKDGAPRKFGGFVLQLLLKRSPKSKVAKDAKAKMKASGI